MNMLHVTEYVTWDYCLFSLPGMLARRAIILPIFFSVFFTIFIFLMVVLGADDLRNY